MKKIIALSLVLCLMLGAFAGCSSSNSGAGDNTLASGSTDGDKAPEQNTVDSSAGKKVTFWYYFNGINQQEAIAKLIDGFNSSQSDIVVEGKYIPFADLKKQLSIGATASDLPDLVIIDSPDHASYAAMGIFADITDKVDASPYFEGPIESATFDGKLYGLPLGSNCLALYYNEDMLAAAGQSVPKTWDELRVTAKALSSDTVSGLAFCSLQNEEGTFNFSPWLWSTGATSTNINNEDGIRALTFIGELVADGSMTKEVINWTQGDVMNQFISGNVAMMVNGPWQIPSIKELAPDLNWNVTLIPKDKEYASVLGGENFAVINNDNVDNTMVFLDYATSADVVKTYIDIFGYISPRKDIASSQFVEGDIMNVFAEEMQYAKPRGPHPRWPEISDAISLAFNETITQASSPEAAAEQAQQTIDNVLAG